VVRDKQVKIEYDAIPMVKRYYVVEPDDIRDSVRLEDPA
jgi:hypothetical protein